MSFYYEHWLFIGNRSHLEGKQLKAKRKRLKYKRRQEKIDRRMSKHALRRQRLRTYRENRV